MNTSETYLRMTKRELVKELLHSQKCNKSLGQEINNLKKTIAKSKIKKQQVLFTANKIKAADKKAKLYQSNEDKFRSYAEHAPDFILELDRDGSILFINKTYGRVSEEELSSSKVFDWVPANERKRFKEKLSKLFSTGMSQEFDFKVENYGKLRWYSAKLGAISINGKISSAILIVRNINERKKAEEALKVSEEKYKDLVEKAGIAILIDNLDGKFEYYNDQFKNLFGYSDEELKDQSIGSLVHPDDVERVMKYHNNRLSGKASPSRYDFRVIRKDGEVLSLEVDAVLLKEKGKSTGTRSYIRDITESKANELQVLESEKRNKAVSEMTSDWVCKLVLNEKGELEFEWVTEGLFKNFGINLEEIKYSNSWVKYIHPDDFKRFKKFIRNTLAGRKGEIEIRLKYKKSMFRWVQIYSRPEWNSNKKKVVAVIGAIKDITHKKLVFEKEKYHANLLNNVSDAVISTDMKFRIISWNKGAEKIYGWKSFEVMGDKVDNIIPITFQDANGIIELKSLFKMGTWQGEIIQPRKDGKILVIYSSVTLIKDESGKPIGAVGVNRDISMQKESEKKMNRWSWMFKHAHWGISTSEDGKRIQALNPAFAKMHGYEMHELIDIPFSKLTLKQYRDDYKNNIEKAFKNGNCSFESINIRKDGSAFTSLVELTGVKNKSGHRLYHVAHIHDITEKKRAEKEIRDSHDQLRALAANLQTVREKERAKLAREIHDELSQVLTGLKFDIAAVEEALLPKKIDKKDLLLEKIISMSSLLDTAVSLVRRITTELRPIILDRLGLLPAIEWLAEDFRNRSGIACSLKIPKKLANINLDLSTAIFRILQESLINILRHAGAEIVDINLQTKNGIIILKIRDDGKGISPGDLIKQDSFGILGMQERAIIFGGNLEVLRTKPNGTLVKLNVPIQ
jgi:PAS domain S-box-containing protein